MNPTPDTPSGTDVPTPVVLHPRTSIEQVEAGQELAPRFDWDGLIACVTTDAGSGDVLMQGYMNREALDKTLQQRARGEALTFTESRKTFDPSLVYDDVPSPTLL